VGLVAIGSRLPTRARNRNAYEGDRERDFARKAKETANRELNRSAKARERQAETAERQYASLDLRRR